MEYDEIFGDLTHAEEAVLESALLKLSRNEDLTPVELAMIEQYHDRTHKEAEKIKAKERLTRERDDGKLPPTPQL